MKILLILYICGYVLTFFDVKGGKATSKECTDLKAKSCGDCISIYGCAWCEDEKYADNPNVPISRCNTPEVLSEKCPKLLIANPKSSSRPINATDLSNVGESEVGSATQMKPQTMEVKLRPGNPVEISFLYKQAEDYPVDLYYLLDLSNSMKNDLESLRVLGQELGERMQSITRDFKLGFGSFVDKTVMPYISTVPAKKKNPCSALVPCDPAYSFHNDLPLSSNINEFVDSVNNVTDSGNLDFPEGGLDAMMQAIVCQDRIKWRKKATHLLVYSTDATFHYAGDGKLGGIVFPNDGNCYMNNLGHYTKADEMDYPSIGHLVRKITEFTIQPIFAVTSDVIETYKNLQKMIPKSVVGHLTSNSSNIIGLIQDAYNDLKGQIIMEVHASKDVNITNKKSNCSDPTVKGLKCDGVKLGDVVNFTFTLSTDKCLDGPVLVQIQPYGYDEHLNITVLPLCDCDCDDVDTSPQACSGHGQFQCGACVCDAGYVGLDCSCNPKEVSSDILQEYLKNCTAPDDTEACSGRGECQCGTCSCKQEENKIISGEYCQCDNTNCPRSKGKMCNGQGTCECGKCECNPLWSGPACECSLDVAPCMAPRDGAIDPSSPCNGRGTCECGKCQCFSHGSTEFRGEFCQTKVVSCNEFQDCIQCKSYGTGRYNATEQCEALCTNYNVSTLPTGGTSSYQINCVFTDHSDDCSFVAHIDESKENQILVEVEAEKKCKTYVNPIYIIIGIIAAIVGIGLAILLIWKLLTSIKDAREFKNFQKESQNPKWNADENPIYKKATSTFRNPMYTGGKPASD